MEIKVPSKTTNGDYHNVKITMECDCVGAGIYKEHCRHIKAIEKLIKQALRTNQEA